MMFQTTCRFSSYLSNKISTTQTQQKRLFRLEASAADVVLYSDPRQKQTAFNFFSWCVSAREADLRVQREKYGNNFRRRFILMNIRMRMMRR